MALPASGAISLNQVNVELGAGSTSTRSLNDSTTRTLFGVASGQISLSQGYGKANQFSFNISSNQTNANLRTLAVNAGWNQTTKVVATVNSGIYISSNGTGTPALTVDGSFPGGIELINSGTIVGRGGNGGIGKNSGQPGGNGSGGGPALSVSSPVSINNAGTIAGGGGGGGGGRLGYSNTNDKYVYYFGGGGGGGRSSLTNSSGGSPNGGTGTISAYGNGGPGTGGGAGGPALAAAPGNRGGGWGEAGVSGGYAVGSVRNGNGGGSGTAVSGNGNVTWLATGTRLGGIS